MKATRKQFHSAIKGKKVLIEVLGTESEVFVSHKEAWYMYVRTDGNVAWAFRDDGTVSIMFAAMDRFGQVGELV